MKLGMGAALVFLAAVLVLPTATPFARSNTAPSIVEIGPTFRSQVRGVAVGNAGVIWIGESDGIARLTRAGTVTEVRRSDECYDCGGGEVVVGAGDNVWENGFDRILRFAGTRLLPYDVGHNSCGWSGIRGFAATDVELYTTRQDEAGLRQLDRTGSEDRLLRGVSGIESIARALDGQSLWLAISSNPGCGTAVPDRLAFYVPGHELEAIDIGGLAAYRLFRHLAAAPDGGVIVDATARDDVASAGGTTILLHVSRGGKTCELVRVPQPNSESAVGGITAAPNGDIWFTLPSANRVARLDSAGRETLYRDGIPRGASPDAIALDKDGSVWFTDSSLNTVEHLTRQGAVHVYGNGLTPWNIPGGPVVTRDGTVWFRETLSWHAVIARIARDGALTEFSDAPESTGTLQIDPQNDDGVVALQMSSDVRPALPSSAVRLSPSGQIRPYDTAGCIITGGNFACLPQLRRFGTILVPRAWPNWAARGPDGNLWFTDSVNSQIGRMDVRGRVTYFTKGLRRWQSGPQYITSGADGALWFTEQRDRVGRITTDGRIQEFSKGIPVRSYPGGIVAGSDGNMWFTLYHGNELARITPKGVVARYRRGIYPSRGNDSAIVDSIPFVDSTGRIWFNEPQGGRIAVATLRAQP